MTPLVPDDGPNCLGPSAPRRCPLWSLRPDFHSRAVPWTVGWGSRLTDGVSCVQTPGPVSPPGAADSGNPSPKHRPSFGSTETPSLSPLQPRAIVSAVIYVKAFVGLLVLTVSVLSNGNNYGAFHPLFTG